MKVIIISGPTGSGKTTLSRTIQKKIKNAIILSTDNYYKTGVIRKILSKIIESYFDKIISFNYKLFIKDFNYILKNSKLNHKYSYNFENKTRTKSYCKISNIKFLIVEGIFAKELMYGLSINNYFEKHDFFFIELETNKLICMKRVINRDVIERGKSKKLAKINFLKSWITYYSRNEKIESKENFFELTIPDNTDIDIALNKMLNLKL